MTDITKRCPEGRSLKSQPGADCADSDMAFGETFYVWYRVGLRRASPELVVLQSLEWGGEHHLALITHKTCKYVVSITKQLWNERSPTEHLYLAGTRGKADIG